MRVICSVATRIIQDIGNVVLLVKSVKKVSKRAFCIDCNILPSVCLVRYWHQYFGNVFLALFKKERQIVGTSDFSRDYLRSVSYTTYKISSTYRYPHLSGLVAGNLEQRLGHLHTTAWCMEDCQHRGQLCLGWDYLKHIIHYWKTNL